MKVHNTIKVVFCALLATLAIPMNSAHASRAVIAVLGTGDAGYILNGGSFFYENDYNIFYNPSYVNEFRNWAIIEKSNFPGTTAQGGFYTSFINFSFGAYFNRGDATALLPFTNATQMRPFEITVGADMTSFKWGITYQHGGYNGTTGGVGSDSNYNALSFGAQVAGFDPFVIWNFSGSDTSGGTTTEFKRLVAGLRYHFGEWTPYAAYRRDSTNSATSLSAMVLGIGRSTRIGEGVRAVYALAYVRNMSSNTNIIPIDIAAEADAASWVTVRAGLSYHLVDRTDSVSNGDNTTGRIGATFHLTKAADFDWAFGRNFTANGAEAGTQLNGQTFDLNGIFSVASLTYKF